MDSNSSFVEDFVAISIVKGGVELQEDIEDKEDSGCQVDNVVGETVGERF